MAINFSKYIANSADPGIAENRIERILKDEECSKILNDLPQPVVESFVDIISLSSFLYRFMCRNPTSIGEIGKQFDESYLRTLKIDNIDDLRRIKYEQLIRITWMDLSNKFDYRIILWSLSYLAEFILNQTILLSLKEEQLKIINSNLSVFALGKLGAAELNFSSDIDLVFVCSNLSDIKMIATEYQKILQDSIRKISYQLEQRSADGFLYRVDLNLRPWGRSGPLVMTVDETENYYEASSQAWERIAWLRARPISGSSALSDDLINRLQPFIYRRSLSTDDIERFLQIKNEMQIVRQRKGSWNVKLGEGGIRDLEFFIQILQLVNAYSNKKLQTTGTLNVLSELNRADLISDIDSKDILHSYLFLRRLENRLQMVDEQQTHNLPDNYQQRLIIARSLGEKGDSDNKVIDKFENELVSNRSIAKNNFESLLPEKKNLISKIDAINNSYKVSWHEEMARNSNERWYKICEQEGWGSVPDKTSLLIKIFGASWYFTRLAFNYGQVVVSLIDSKIPPELNKSSFIKSMHVALEFNDMETCVNELKIIKNICMLKILLAYLDEKLEIEKVEVALTELAEATFLVLIKILQKEPKYVDFPVSVLGMGRMAGYEMTFGSDLDLIFLYESVSPELNSNIGRTIRMLLRLIAHPSSSGMLYEVDMRLRPHGSSGSLVTSYESFLEYHNSDREIWERQMMTRCRPIIIMSENVNEVLNEVNSSIYQIYHTEYLREHILSMRRRVQYELGSPKNKYEIKRGKGGLMDIDFISHYFQLLHGKNNTTLQTGSTRAVIRELGNSNIINSAVAAELIGGYNYLKRIEMCLRLFDLKSIDAFPTVESENIPLARAMGHGDNTKTFCEEYISTTRSIRNNFVNLIGSIN
jgi:glutamate-ammonia-ligase adenylyltransferase